MISGSHNLLQRLGIYGGTFDPPHLGHLILAETAIESLGLARVLFVPAADPPHKPSDMVRTPIHHRCAMVERATAGNPRFALSDLDRERPGPHYSVDLLHLLRAEHPGAVFVFLMGADSLRDLPTWSRPSELIQLAKLGVMRRPNITPDLAALERQIPGLTQQIEWIEAPLIDITARELAETIATGKSARYQIPDAVQDYIRHYNLYRN